MERVQELLLWFVPFLFSLSFHETAHAWVANLLGDSTAKMMGRVSLNPVAHADPIGTILLPIMGFLTHLPLIGWAKPVPVIERNLKNPLRDGMLVALAGPASNVLLACVFAFALFILNRMPDSSASLQMSQAGFLVKAPLMQMAVIGIRLNFSLALFNFLPMPPLDGSRILYGIFPGFREIFYKIQPYSMVIFIFMLYSNILNVIVFLPARIASDFLLMLAVGQ